MLSLRTYSLQLRDLTASSLGGAWIVTLDLAVAVPTSEEHISRAAHHFLSTPEGDLRDRLMRESRSAAGNPGLEIPPTPLASASTWALGLLHRIDQALSPLGYAALQIEAHATPVAGVPGEAFHVVVRHPRWGMEESGESPDSGRPQEPVQVVLCTVPDAETGARIGRALVDERLAACVNLVPGVRSIYRWEGEVCDEAEVLMIVKTAADRFGDLRSRLKAMHPYTTPEILALRPEDGWPAYLRWVAENTRPPRMAERP